MLLFGNDNLPEDAWNAPGSPFAGTEFAGELKIKPGLGSVAQRGRVDFQTSFSVSLALLFRPKPTRCYIETQKPKRFMDGHANMCCFSLLLRLVGSNALELVGASW